MFRLISVSPKHMFHSREDQSSALQSFSLPHINVSPKHIFWSGEDRSSASFALLVFHLYICFRVGKTEALLCRASVFPMLCFALLVFHLYICISESSPYDVLPCKYSSLLHCI